MDMQALLDGMSAKDQRERAKTQMTLGKMIHILESFEKNDKIDGIAEPHSYRGYYNDLAFESIEDKIEVSDALFMCQLVMGNVFEGYKGGDFVMGALTPVWLANYGNCGLKLMSIGNDGKFITEEDNL